MFTKNDLKTGMFGIVRGENDPFVVVGNRLIYMNGGWDEFEDFNDDLVFRSGRVISKVYDDCVSFDQFNELTNGTSLLRATLVYDRERDTKPLYNGKVVCIDATINEFYTVGKIYQFKDGQLTADYGKQYPKDNPLENRNSVKIHNFEDWSKWSTAEWLEIKE